MHIEVREKQVSLSRTTNRITEDTGPDAATQRYAAFSGRPLAGTEMKLKNTQG